MENIVINLLRGVNLFLLFFILFSFTEEIFVFKNTVLDDLILGPCAREILEKMEKQHVDVYSAKIGLSMMYYYYHMQGIASVIYAREYTSKDALPPCFHPLYGRYSSEFLKNMIGNYKKIINILDEVTPHLAEFKDDIRRLAIESSQLKAAVYDCYDPREGSDLRSIIVPR